jgi:iron-sulfur cluster assembly accessory protein
MMETQMEIVEQTVTETITLTESAADAVRGLLEQRNLQGYSLRVYVSGGGCSGFQYGMTLDNNIRTEDTVTEMNGIKVLVDEVSIQYLQGATVDYVEGTDTSGFKITNPNSLPSCGCGQETDATDGSSCPGCS